MKDVMLAVAATTIIILFLEHVGPVLGYAPAPRHSLAHL